MQVPNTRLFTAGETLTGSVLNQTVTSLGNFLLGKPIFQAYASGTQSAWSSGSSAAVLFDTEIIDRDNSHVLTPAADTGKYTAKTPGWYRVTGQAFFAGSTTGNTRATWLRKNGSTAITGSASRLQSTSLPAGAVAVQCFPSLVYLNGTTDYVELMAYHDNGTTLGLAAPIANQGISSIMIEWVSL